MVEFNEGEWFRIAGRGYVFATTNKTDRTDFKDILNNTVLIQGNEYYVIGEEQRGYTSSRKGGLIGLLVKGPKKEPKVGK